jgi:hypothetical protein
VVHQKGGHPPRIFGIFFSPTQRFFTPTNTLHTGIIVASYFHPAPPDLPLQLDLFFTTCVKFGFVVQTDFLLNTDSKPP